MADFVIPGWIADMPVGNLIITAAFFIGIVVVIVKGWPLIKKTFSTLDALSDLPETLERIDKRLEHVEHETKPNSGMSMKDRSNQDHATLAEQSAQLHDIQRQLAELKATNNETTIHINPPTE